MARIFKSELISLVKKIHDKSNLTARIFVCKKTRVNGVFMAEERLIDEDKDRRYKLKKNADGLEIEEDDFLVFEIPEDIEGGDVAYRAKIDKNENGKK